MSRTQGGPPAVPPLAMKISALFDALVEALHTALPAAGFTDIRPAHSINLFRVIDDEGTRPTVLARRAGVTPQAMAEITRYLEDHGYAERLPDPDDGRARIVRLTPRGREAAAVAGRVFTDLEAKWEEHLGGRQMAQLRTMVGELASLGTGQVRRALGLSLNLCEASGAVAGRADRLNLGRSVLRMCDLVPGAKRLPFAHPARVSGSRGGLVSGGEQACYRVAEVSASRLVR